MTLAECRLCSKNQFEQKILCSRAKRKERQGKEQRCWERKRKPPTKRGQELLWKSSIPWTEKSSKTGWSSIVERSRITFDLLSVHPGFEPQIWRPPWLRWRGLQRPLCRRSTRLQGRQQTSQRGKEAVNCDPFARYLYFYDVLFFNLFSLWTICGLIKESKSYLYVGLQSIFLCVILHESSRNKA